MTTPPKSLEERLKREQEKKRYDAQFTKQYLSWYKMFYTIADKLIKKHKIDEAMK